jgi:hypothetical protein
VPAFMLLLRDDQSNYDAMKPEDFEALFQRFVQWAETLERDKKLLGVERLGVGGRTVRQREGRIVVDGPYTEGKETVMGFFLVEAADEAEAARIAAQAPSVAVGGVVEVREVASFPRPKLS